MVSKPRPRKGLASLMAFALLATGMSASHMAAGGQGRTDLSAKDRARVSAVTAPAKEFDTPERFETMSAGAATSTATPDGNAFSHPSANLDFEGEERFKLGNGLFKKVWVASPSSTRASDGLGPLFNARSCQRCHLKDGRGHPPSGPEDSAVSMFLRLSIPPQSDQDRALIDSGRLARIPEPTYGGQLQDFAVPGLPAEGRMRIEYEEFAVELKGEAPAMLRKPTYSIGDLGYGPMHPETLMSPRIASPMIGLGLLEAIHPDDILRQADPEDSNADGISGRASYYYDPATDAMVLARFGWKASMPTVEIQSAHAFSGDIGLSTPLVPEPWGDCTEGQPECRRMPHGVQKNLGDSEAPPPVLDLVSHYARNLAVPARRNIDDPAVLRGKAHFYQAGCVACHTPKYVTSRDADHTEHRFQLIWPYTDLLLHDMGEGLADGRPVGSASGQEWRTPPLWGIGLTETVNGHTFFLHDGRARSLLEAILWHGGEAQAARDAVTQMTPAARRDLIRFLESL